MSKSKNVIAKNDLIFDPEDTDLVMKTHQSFADNGNLADLNQMVEAAEAVGLNERYSVAFTILTDMLREIKGGVVDPNQFLTELSARIGTCGSEEGRENVLKVADVDGDNKITAADLRVLNKEGNHGLDNNQIDFILQELGNGHILNEQAWTDFVTRDR